MNSACSNGVANAQQTPKPKSDRLDDNACRQWPHLSGRIAEFQRMKRDDLVLIGVGIAIGVAVCYPFFGGRLLLLDWVSGPNQPIIPASAWGLASPSAAGLPSQLAANAVEWILGPAGSWLPVLVFFPLAMFSAGTLVGGVSFPAWRLVSSTQQTHSFLTACTRADSASHRICLTSTRSSITIADCIEPRSLVVRPLDWCPRRM